MNPEAITSADAELIGRAFLIAPERMIQEYFTWEHDLRNRPALLKAMRETAREILDIAAPRRPYSPPRIVETKACDREPKP